MSEEGRSVGRVEIAPIVPTLSLIQADPESGLSGNELLPRERHDDRVVVVEAEGTRLNRERTQSVGIELERVEVGMLRTKPLGDGVETPPVDRGHSDAPEIDCRRSRQDHDHYSVPHVSDREEQRREREQRERDPPPDGSGQSTCAERPSRLWRTSVAAIVISVSGHADRLPAAIDVA